MSPTRVAAGAGRGRSRDAPAHAALERPQPQLELCEPLEGVRVSGEPQRPGRLGAEEREHPPAEVRVPVEGEGLLRRSAASAQRRVEELARDQLCRVEGLRVCEGRVEPPADFDHVEGQERDHRAFREDERVADDELLHDAAHEHVGLADVGDVAFPDGAAVEHVHGRPTRELPDRAGIRVRRRHGSS